MLQNLGIEFEIIKAEADESSDEKDPGALTELLAKRKAKAASKIKSDGLIIGCDTVVFCDGIILGKPKDEADAENMIRSLSGRRHAVVSGICVKLGEKYITAHETTYVDFCQMSDEEIKKCVALGAPMDKAGGYAIQGYASLFIKGIEGDYFNVVGMPINLLYRTVKENFGIRLG